MNDKTMARADFFKYVVGKTVSMVGEVTGDLVKPFTEASNTALGMVLKPLLPVDEYDGRVKLLMSCKPPLFIIGRINENCLAVEALCEDDGFLLSYQSHEDSFSCGICGKRHDINRTDDAIETDLKTIPLVIREGQICLLSGS